MAPPIVTGLAVTDDGSTYVTTNGGANHTDRFLSIAALGQQWKREALPSGLVQNAFLYGGGGERLVFWHGDGFTMAFVDALQ